MVAAAAAAAAAGLDPLAAPLELPGLGETHRGVGYPDPLGLPLGYPLGLPLGYPILAALVMMGAAAYAMPPL